ncbi:MAG: hypothetical protein M3065_10665 [Actinomycetota bacterium]|nr:hypothetical protein [Actinomycetota bacterium]
MASWMCPRLTSTDIGSPSAISTAVRITASVCRRSPASCAELEADSYFSRTSQGPVLRRRPIECLLFVSRQLCFGEVADLRDRVSDGGRWIPGLDAYDANSQRHETLVESVSYRRDQTRLAGADASNDGDHSLGALDSSAKRAINIASFELVVWNMLVDKQIEATRRLEREALVEETQLLTRHRAASSSS